MRQINCRIENCELSVCVSNVKNLGSKKVACDLKSSSRHRLIELNGQEGVELIADYT